MNNLIGNMEDKIKYLLSKFKFIKKYIPRFPAIFILAFIIFGAILRIYKLSFQSYWHDEVCSILRVLDGYFFKHITSMDAPLFDTILYFWIRIFGYHNEASTKILSVIFSIAALPVMYLITKELFDKKTALYSMLLLTFSTYHIYYAQELRMYSLFWFLVLASNLYFIKLVKDDKKLNWLIYFITTVLAFYAHYSFFWIFLAQNLFIFLFWKKYNVKLKRWAASLVILIVILLPWIWFSVIPHLLFPALVKNVIHLWIPYSTYKVIFETLIFFTWGQEWILQKLGREFLLFCNATMPIIAAMILWNIRFVFMPKKAFDKRAEMVFILLWCCLPVAISYLVSILIRPIYVVRYVSVSFLALNILIAYTLSKIKSTLLKFIILTVILVPNIIALNYYYNFPVKAQMREFAHYLKQKYNIGDRFLMHTELFGHATLPYYYPGITDVFYLSSDAINEVINKRVNFWLLLPARYKQSLEYLKSEHLISEDFKHTYYQVDLKEFLTIRAYYFKRN